MNIIVKCSTKWAEKNTFWNKIKCYFTLHTILVMFSQQLGLKKTWRCRKNSGRGLILCLRHGFAFSRRLETYMTSSNAAALRTQNDRCMTLSKHRESYREQTTPHAFESLSRYFDVIHWSSAWCCSKSNTPIATFHPLLELQSANFSPPPGKIK